MKRFLIVIGFITPLVQAKKLNDTVLIAHNGIQSLASLAAVDGQYGNISLLSSSTQSYVGFFELDEKDIEVSVVGASDAPVRIKGKLSFFKAQIDESEKDRLKQYLIGLGVKAEGIDEISEQLIRGVNGSRECKGNKSDCLVFQPEFITVVDFYNNRLRLFIPNKWFETNAQKIVLDTFSESLWVSSWYGSISYSDEVSYFMRSENTYGLGDGYIKYDFNVSDYSKRINQFNYNYDAPSYSLTGGIITSTKRLGVAGQNSLINERFIGVDLSNQKLLEIKNFAARSVDFFSPSEGVLTVYKSNGEQIYQSNIVSGRNSIPYSYLPYGNYAVSYKVMNNDELVFKGDHFVSNSDAFDASEVSMYARLGMKEQTTTGNKDRLLFDTGISMPIHEQQSAIASVSLVEDEWFGGLGYYANINDYRLSIKYSLSENAYRLNTDIYSRLLNLSIVNTNVRENKSSYLGNQDSLSISSGLSQTFGPLSLALSVSYNDVGELKYLNYNFNSNYSFKNGVSLYTTYSGGGSQDTLSIGVSIPLSSQTHYNVTYNDNQGSLELNNRLTNMLRVDNQLSLNSGISYRHSENQENGAGVYINSNYRNQAFTGSAGIRRQENGNMTYNGSFSTTAYLTENRVFFKDASPSHSSAIEVVGINEALQGRVKLYDKVSGRRNTKSISNYELLEMQPYTQMVIDYEFDNEEFALDEVNMDRNSTIDMLPGKIHYLNVKQQPVGNVLIVNNGSNTEGISCTGEACVDEKAVNGKVLKFRVKPGKKFSIHRNGQMCFSGEVSQGQTRIGVCQK
ncbi:TcfC E-set like domain-containing protein [Vibrio cholerae]|uniref:TcfC E-set like domain-containing protein n=1 Tax=Vibrio cholerae TaxID=666 RepID=UPI002E32B3B4|nr:TcfC E-set like domain-containing protein [Vibrio cholerae]MED7816349.1 TcfC E-set like domain-containing protein [Vibrio cholerae]